MRIRFSTTAGSSRQQADRITWAHGRGWILLSNQQLKEYREPQVKRGKFCGKQEIEDLKSSRTAVKNVVAGFWNRILILGQYNAAPSYQQSTSSLFSSGCILWQLCPVRRTPRRPWRRRQRRGWRTAFFHTDASSLLTLFLSLTLTLEILNLPLSFFFLAHLFDLWSFLILPFVAVSVSNAPPLLPLVVLRPLPVEDQLTSYEHQLFLSPHDFFFCYSQTSPLTSNVWNKTRNNHCLTPYTRL